MQNHITTENLEEEMKAQTLAKRTVVPHEEKRLTMKHSPQKTSPLSKTKYKSQEF